MFFKKSIKIEAKPDLSLEKWHALGNDFLISKIPFSAEEIKRISDRNFGIGCDQFIILEEKTVRFFNPDGTESGMCGNALKCVGEIIWNNSNVQEISLNVSGREIPIKMEEGMTSICMGSPLKFKEEGNPFLYTVLEDIPNNHKKKDINYDFFKLLQNKENNFYFVDLGNPHLVCILNLSEEDPLLQRKIFDTFLSSERIGEIINYLGESLQRDFLKTSGINVSFVAIESPKEVYVRTYERGVGETLSCGSGACASVFASIKNGNVSRETVKVFNRGSEKTENISESFNIISLDSEEKIILKGKGTKIGTIILNK